MDATALTDDDDDVVVDDDDDDARENKNPATPPQDAILNTLTACIMMNESYLSLSLSLSLSLEKRFLTHILYARSRSVCGVCGVCVCGV